MTSKERIACLLRGKIPDRVGRVEAPWPETRARWYREGLPAGVHANDHFVMDIRHLLKVDTSFQLPSAVLEDGPDYQVVQTSDGGTTKCWKHTGIPHPLSFGIACAEDWNRLCYRPHGAYQYDLRFPRRQRLRGFSRHAAFTRRIGGAAAGV